MKTTVRCTICPKGCELADGETGDCRVRMNVSGTVRCTTYARPCAMQVDPIEKKPLFHMLPGEPILSIATAGCNLHCKQCQNWQISQSDAVCHGTELLPEDLPGRIRQQGCRAVAYTYTEPLVSYEYLYDCAKAVHEAGLYNVLVTAAFINPRPLRNLCPYIDAANIDLKAFSDDFYRSICDARLKPVLKAIEIMKEAGILLEITHLIIPTLNDDPEETRRLCDWVCATLGPETPLHLSRFFPCNELHHLPPTPTESIRKAVDIARRAGLHHVYTGNLHDGEGEDTHCPNCRTRVIHRSVYRLVENRLNQGACPECGKTIRGIWS